MLKHRLLFGTLMAVVFIGLILLESRFYIGLPEGAVFLLLVSLLMIPAHFELGNLIKQTGAHVFKTITIPASIILASLSCWLAYPWADLLLVAVLPFSFLAIFLAQALKFGTEGTIRNVSASIFSIIYLGLLCAFIVAIRNAYGPGVLLFFVFVIKSSDIGAYAFGRLFGKHKLCPSISPGKTWEGLAGAAAVAAGVSFVFSHVCGIMPPLWAVGFGAVFGVLGQLGDLVESMIKRDAASKDSSGTIPGFGGLLDVIDSPLATAPAAYVVFMLLL